MRLRRAKPGEKLLSKNVPAALRDNVLAGVSESDMPIQRKLFVFEMVKEICNGDKIPSQTDAALRAGYSPVSACEQAVRLMKDPRVKAEIDNMMKKLESRTLMTAEHVLSNIKTIGDRCMQEEPVLDNKGRPTGEYKFDSQGALRAQELLGKNLKLFTDKVEQTGEVTINIAVHKIDPGKMIKET